MEINTEDCTAIFPINEIGDTTRSTYIGAFKVKCILDPMDFMESDKLYRQLLGDVHPENAHEHSSSVAFALSQLKYRVIEVPPFWENARLGGGHVKDPGIIISVLNLAMEAEQIYREMMAKEAEERQKALTERIKSKMIEPEPEVKQKKDEENQKLIDLDEKDGANLDQEEPKVDKEPEKA